MVVSPRLGKAHSPVAYHWRDVAIELDGPKSDPGNIVAGQHAGAQATDAGGDRIGQQDGPDGLGDVDETGRLSNPGNGNRRLTERLRKAQAGRGRKKATTRMGKMIEQIWIRKTS